MPSPSLNWMAWKMEWWCHWAAGQRVLLRDGGVVPYLLSSVCKMRKRNTRKKNRNSTRNCLLWWKIPCGLTPPHSLAIDSLLTVMSWALKAYTTGQTVEREDSHWVLMSLSLQPWRLIPLSCLLEFPTYLSGRPVSEVVNSWKTKDTGSHSLQQVVWGWTY